MSVSHSRDDADAVSSTYAKTHFNALLAEIQHTGRTVTITSHGKPVATLAPASGPSPRKFGFMPELGPIASDFDEPLPDNELGAWEGGT